MPLLHLMIYLNVQKNMISVLPSVGGRDQRSNPIEITPIIPTNEHKIDTRIQKAPEEKGIDPRP